MAADDRAVGTGTVGDELLQIIDGEALLSPAKRLKEEANIFVGRKDFNEAVKLYEMAIVTLDKADGHPMIRQEVEEMLALKAVLYGNMAQCYLKLLLFRRAVFAASDCLRIDPTNVKALNRRSLGQEAVGRYREALDDVRGIQELGERGENTLAVGESAELQKRIMSLSEKIAAKEKAKAEESSDDECDLELVRMKERFDEVVERYNLRNESAAEEVADWLTSGEWFLTVKRVADRWKMEYEDAEDFMKFIMKGVEFQMQSSMNKEALGLPV